MSSTPVKSGESLHSKNSDELLFENDTPIKGHKLKYMAPSQPVAQLAERYFARVSLAEPSPLVKSESADLNSKIYHKTANSKNEDAESGVESEELNKSNEIKHMKQNSIDSKQNRLSFIADTNNKNYTNKYNNTLNVDESLCRLRQKQKDLIESRKFLMHYSDDTVDTTKLNSNQNESVEPSFYNQKDSIKPNNANNNNNSDSNQNLKNYIQSLENKLQYLRKEMNENTTNRDKLGRKQERDLSTDSCDSLKEIKQKTTLDGNKNFSVQLQEFVQQRTQLENHQKKLNILNFENEEKRASFSLASRKFGEEHEELFFKLQTQQQQPCQDTQAQQPNFFENSIGSTSSSDDNNNPNLSLKKSMHKGASSTAYLLSKLNKKSFTTSSPVKSEQQIFSPIIKANTSSLENKNSSKSFDNDLTPRSTYQLINPIPIRLSVSSSIESTIINDENHLNSSRMSNNKSDSGLTPSKLKISNSKIWKSASVSSSSQSASQDAINVKPWSSMSNEKQYHQSAMDVNTSSKPPLTESLMSHLSGFDLHNKMPLSEHGKNRTKDLLVVAHDYITETCKQEMNLLSCLKDSQMVN